MLSVTHADCHLCWEPHTSHLCWLSLRWMSLCWVSWPHPTMYNYKIYLAIWSWENYSYLLHSILQKYCDRFVCIFNGSFYANWELEKKHVASLDWKHKTKRTVMRFQTSVWTDLKMSFVSNLNLSSWGQCYKTFCVRNLLIFVQSYTVCKNRLEKRVSDKHPSLLRKCVNYE